MNSPTFGKVVVSAGLFCLLVNAANYLFGSTGIEGVKSLRPLGSGGLVHPALLPVGMVLVAIGAAMARRSKTH